MSKESAIVDKIKAKVPALLDVSQEHEDRLNRALGTIATGMMMASTLEEDSGEYQALQTEMSYAKTTVSALKGVKWLEVEKAGREIVEEAFQSGVRGLLSSLR